MADRRLRASAKLASAAYRLLGRIEHIPGTDSEGKVNAEELLDWIAEARLLCAEHGRVELGDQKIGELCPMLLRRGRRLAVPSGLQGDGEICFPADWRRLQDWCHQQARRTFARNR